MTINYSDFEMFFYKGTFKYLFGNTNMNVQLYGNIIVGRKLNLKVIR